MKLDEHELLEVERLALAWPQPAGNPGGEGSRERPLALSVLLDRRRRLLEGKVG